MSKTNKAGEPCPTWCETDHETGIPYAHIAHSAHVAAESGSASTMTYQSSANVSPDLEFVTAEYAKNDDIRGRICLATRQAADRAAVLIEHLAGYTPDAHREIAAQIRQSSANAWPEAEAG